VGVTKSFPFFRALSIISTSSACGGRVESTRFSETFFSYPNNICGTLPYPYDIRRAIKGNWFAMIPYIGFDSSTGHAEIRIK
jgi:hypothetical protein